MATKKFNLAALSLAFIFAACGDDNSSANTEQNISDSEDISVSVNEVSGVTQKGPFLMGSKVQMFEISNGRSLNQTGKSFNGKISNDKGEFKIKGSKLASQYVILEASGYYRNEITGKNSNSELTLLAISDVSDRNTINVNLLTHLEYERVNYLVTEQNLKVDEAKKQAQKEILDIFNIDNTNFSNSEDLNIAGASDEDGALLAISVLLQGDQSESQLSELLTKIAIDMEEDGEWNDDAKKNAIADWAAEIILSGRIATIRSNVEKWQLSSIVPNFEKHINNFWWTNYGLGTCDKKREGEVLQNSNAQSANYETYYICKDRLWKMATTIEYDTFQWNAETDGRIKKGNVTDSIYVFEMTAWRTASNVEAKLGGCVNAIADSVGKVGSTYYICKSNEWVKASTIEYDTHHWTAGRDGDSKWGSVNTANCYVFENNAWRSGNESDCSLELRGCTTLRQDTVGKGSDDVWYKCDSQTWRTATDIEKDTATWGTGKFDGEVRSGLVNKSSYYIYEANNKAWRNASTLEKDTYDYKNNKAWANGTDGEIKNGSVTDTIYVFDETTWRVADDIEKILGGCVTAIQDSIGKVGNIYYICNPRKWNVATALQYDTYKHKCTKDGKMFNGYANTTTKYVCDNDEFREANTIEVEADSACTSYNRNRHYILPKYDGKNNYSYYKCTEDGWIFTTEKLNKGNLIDERDGHEYKTIGIKNQLWMAENLNYADSAAYPSMVGKNWCFDNDEDNCIKNGRLYDGGAALHSSVNTEINYSTIVQGICPNGWHVPNCLDWVRLDDAQDTIYHFYDNHPGMYILGGDTARTTHYDEGTFVKDEIFFSSSYWSSYWNYDWSTVEYYEGCYNSGIGYYWTANSNRGSFDYGCAYLGYSTCGFPVRCIKDEE